MQYALCLALTYLLSNPASAEELVPFDSEHWDVHSGVIEEHMGRTSLAGSASLHGVQFLDGVIEVDISVTGARSYPGVSFRVGAESRGSELFYIRPHKSGKKDALQYAPVLNNQTCWQLYFGQGYTQAAKIEPGRWIPMKIEVRGGQARFTFDDGAVPPLFVTDLKLAPSPGGITLRGPADRTVHFSRFRYRSSSEVDLPSPTRAAVTPGALRNWEVSAPFKLAEIDREVYPRFYGIFLAGWRPAVAEPDGLVNVSRLASRSGGGADCVFARTTVRSPKKQRVKMWFGYSDEVTIFVNRKPIFFGDSRFLHRDPDFHGNVGYNDAVYLDLERGLNEIFLVLAETFGGWGFQCRTETILESPRTDRMDPIVVWETPPVFRTPECVLVDPKRDLLYVSSFDQVTDRGATGFLSRLSLDGEIQDLHWVESLDGPTGMAMSGGHLWVVERSSLTKIDPDSGAILERVPMSSQNFLNDVIADDDGYLYVSDTTRHGEQQDLLRWGDGRLEVWKHGHDLHRVNGLLMEEGKLLAGSSGTGLLQWVDLEDGRVHDFVCLGSGTIDGFRRDGNGDLLVSHWEGQVYRVTPEGTTTLILDLSNERLNVADFEFLPEDKLLIVPTFLANRVVAYQL